LVDTNMKVWLVKSLSSLVIIYIHVKRIDDFEYPQVAGFTIETRFLYLKIVCCSNICSILSTFSTLCIHFIA
jgi:hypothetical protein